MVDTALDKMVVPTRDVMLEKYRTSYIARAANVDASDPHLEVVAAVSTDAIAPIMARAKQVADGVGKKYAQGDFVLAWAEIEGVKNRNGDDGLNPAVGASGYAEVDTSGGGSTITEFETLTFRPTNFVYEVAQASGAIADGDNIFLRGVTVGPKSDLPPGAVLYWDTSVSGRGDTVTVVASESDGRGLSGGQNEETVELLKERVRRAKADRGHNGNDADYRAVCMRTPGLSIQQVFTFPGIRGTGTTAICFTLVPSTSGGSRSPSSGQVAEVQTYATTPVANGGGGMPEDDGAFFCLLTEVNADVVAKVVWDQDALGWMDLHPWPPYRGGLTGGGTAFTISAATSATVFTIAGTTGEPPTIGQTFCVFDAVYLTHRKKRVLSFTGGSTGPWVITCDTTNSSSDTTYTPVVGQRVYPWSESLPALMPTMCEYFDTLGPGEMTQYPYDSGRRMRRQPPAPKFYPRSTTDKGLGDALDLDVLQEATVVEKPDLETTYGTPGVTAPILRLRWFSVFAK